MKKALVFLLTLLMLFSVVLSSCSDENGTASVIDDSSDIQEDNNSSAETEITSSQPEVSQDSESSDASQTPIYEVPENVIYNTLETIANETQSFNFYTLSTDSYSFASKAKSSDKCALEKLIAEYTGDAETWFYVAIDINSTARSKHYFSPSNETRVLEAEVANEYLLGLGFIPNYDHPQSFMQFKNGTTDKIMGTFMVVGYITSDMIQSIDFEDYHFNIMHLPADEDFDEAMEVMDFAALVGPSG